MHDILSESHFYQEIIAMGLEKGLKQGREQGIEQGREQGREQGLAKGQLTALRQAIVDIAHERFPALVEFAESQVTAIDDTTQLRHLVVKMSTVPDAEQATQAFLDVPGAQ